MLYSIAGRRRTGTTGCGWRRRAGGGCACARRFAARTTFGERGSSKGQFYFRFLVPIKLNDVDVPWTTLVRCSLNEPQF